MMVEDLDIVRGLEAFDQVVRHVLAEVAPRSSSRTRRMCGARNTIVYPAALPPPTTTSGPRHEASSVCVAA
jgi:hypothetical protein